jgi:hypothetical protein
MNGCIPVYEWGHDQAADEGADEPDDNVAQTAVSSSARDAARDGTGNETGQEPAKDREPWVEGESSQQVQNAPPIGGSVRDDDANAVHFSVRVNALEVVHPGSALQTAYPTICHDAFTVGTSCHDVRLPVRAVDTLVLDLETAD